MWKLFNKNISRNNAAMTILISEKVVFRTRNIARIKEGHYIIIHQEDITMLHVDTPQNKAYKFIKLNKQN